MLDLRDPNCLPDICIKTASLYPSCICSCHWHHEENHRRSYAHFSPVETQVAVVFCPRLPSPAGQFIVLAADWRVSTAHNACWSPAFSSPDCVCRGVSSYRRFIVISLLLTMCFSAFHGFFKGSHSGVREVSLVLGITRGKRRPSMSPSCHLLYDSSLSLTRTSNHEVCYMSRAQSASPHWLCGSIPSANPTSASTKSSPPFYVGSASPG